MTVVGRHLYTEEMIGGYRYRRSACPRCGAGTLDEASLVCRPHQDPSGEYSCPGSENTLDPFGVKWDASGRACVLTNASAKVEARLLAEWCSEQAAKL